MLVVYATFTRIFCYWYPKAAQLKEALTKSPTQVNVILLEDILKGTFSFRYLFEINEPLKITNN